MSTYSHLHSSLFCQPFLLMPRLWYLFNVHPRSQRTLRGRDDHITFLLVVDKSALPWEKSQFGGKKMNSTLNIVCSGMVKPEKLECLIVRPVVTCIIYCVFVPLCLISQIPLRLAMTTINCRVTTPTVITLCAIVRIHVRCCLTFGIGEIKVHEIFQVKTFCIVTAKRSHATKRSHMTWKALRMDCFCQVQCANSIHGLFV